MKKIVLSSLLFMATMAQAQTEENSVLVGGGLALQTGSGNSQFAFTPTVGYFFADNFVFGGTLNFTNQKLGTVKNNSFGIGPFARYYFGNTSTKPFVVGEFDFLSSKSTQTIANVSTVTKTNGTRFLIGMGFAAFVNESVAVEGVSGYSFSKFKNVDGNGGFTLRFGFGIYFNRRTAKDLKTNVMGK
ncbi:outer membrane beta-barrel protein [Phnomibacter sp. MR]|uniref:outer membrane beta-barrel protein n=1 Tax=Phnomibacter sp. MR TaxID=3042318 RepID=UPI003A804D09